MLILDLLAELLGLMTLEEETVAGGILTDLMRTISLFELGSVLPFDADFVPSLVVLLFFSMVGSGYTMVD